MTRTQFAAALLVIVALAAALRTLYPAADPPWRSTVGIVWHDEGAWTHNARNKALFGAWRLDEWNPVYVAPVFTALEYASFTAFGVGVRQARLVSEIAGVVSVLLLALGVRRIADPLAGLLAGGLIATNYVYVMYDRAAIMEALMVAFIVASWYCSVRAARHAAWGAAAGSMAALAFFTKASAAFYVAALGLVALARLLPPSGRSHEAETNGGPPGPDRAVRRAALWTLAGLAIAAAAIGIGFVLPHWSDYQFYNWQMSVTRKPSYDPRSVLMRVSWFPIVHDVFSRMWLVLCLGVLGGWGIAARWRRATDGERLLLAWIAAGTLELLVHDVGNERRFVFLIPALAALAAIVLASGRPLPPEAASISRRRLLLASPVVLYSAYVLLGPLARLPYLDDIQAHVLRMPVRVAAGGALAAGAAVLVAWPALSRWLSAPRWRPRTALLVLLAAMTWNLVQFTDWALHRSYKNYEASLAVGRALPPGTLVQGKLANGLALENRIRPLFVGHQFGNYGDRKQRWDVRYILTYSDPRIGYEGDQIDDVLTAYPGWRITMTFDVAETPSGHDTAALIEKRARH